MSTLTGIPEGIPNSKTEARATHMANGIDLINWCNVDPRVYRRDYLLSLKPVIVQGALDHWPALNKWTPEFFQERYGSLDVTVDSKAWKLGQLIDRILASTPENPAPYLRNQLVAEWPPELSSDISPMPDCTRPNYLESRLFPTSETYIEAFIGGAGAKFPILHYDNWHTHAFLMQLNGKKEYIVFSPDQARFLHPLDGTQINNSAIPDLENVDLSEFPLFAQAQGIRFELHPGETLFVPGGWWHTARILSTSITISINGVNAGNWSQYRREYCQRFRRYIAPNRRLKVALIGPYIYVLGLFLSMFRD